MIRVTGWVLTLGSIAMLAQPARAQMPAPAFGGFGQEYSQPIPSDSLVLDRWWMLEATPRMDGAPPSVAVERPTAVPSAAGRVARTNRSFARARHAASKRASVQTAAPLPTGSLDWPGASGMPIYSPAQRYASYGWGYGVSPYGTADYGAAYKGYYWGP
jgi:hypothetical protein